MKLYSFFLFLLCSYTFSSTLDYRIEVLAQDILLYQKSENVFSPYIKGAETIGISKFSKYLDLTLDIRDLEFENLARSKGCLEFNAEEIAFGAQCESFRKYLRDVREVSYLVLRDESLSQLPEQCLQLNNNIQFVELSKSSRLRTGKARHSAYEGFPFRCLVRNHQELFLIDYFSTPVSSYSLLKNELLEAYTREGKVSDLVSDYIVRKFVNNSDWFDAQFMRGEFNPYKVYNPAPQTWKTWRDTYFLRVLPFMQSNLPLTQKEIINWYRKSMNDANQYVGFRKGWTRFKMVHQENALSGEELERMLNFDFGLKNLKSISQFSPRVCVEDLTKEQELAFLENEDEKLWPKTTLKKSYNCGIYTYPRPLFLDMIIKKIIKDTNQFLSEKHSDQEVFEFALTQQRRFVAAHPFPDGNGRVSRWLMDFITTRAGIPDIFHFSTMDDFSVPWKEHKAKSKRGMFFNLLVLEKCLKFPRLKECRPETLHDGAIGKFKN